MTKAPSDAGLERAARTIQRALSDPGKRPLVSGFFDADTSTVSYLVEDPGSKARAVVDCVLDFDNASGRTGTQSADRIAAALRGTDGRLKRILETHAHADHLSAAPYLKRIFGGRVGIGREITRVQSAFSGIFNATDAFAADLAAFDDLFADGATFQIGGLDATVLHVPGHTPACVAYVIGDSVFPGDTLFMPDYGSARCDFPGGDPGQLFRSVRRLLRLPDPTRMFVCHDYKAPGRDHYAWETTVGQQRLANIHLNDTVDEVAFVRQRIERDRQLPVPRLLLPSVQVNLRAGRLPLPEGNGVRYLKIPLDAF